MTCQEVDELIPAYALGALPSGQRQEVEAHLANCREHSETLESNRVAVGALSHVVDEITPPPTLRGQILEAVHNDSQPVSIAPVAHRTQRSVLPFRPVYAAAALVIVGLLVWNLVLQFGTGDTEAFVRYMGGDGEHTHAYIYFVDDVGVITAEGLPSLREGEAYQAWTRVDGEVISLGTINLSAGGDGFVLLETHVSEDQRVFVTIEPAPGSNTPSDNLVVWTRD